MPKLNSLKMTHRFWSNYMASLSKAGLLDRTFSEALDADYKCIVEYNQKCQAEGKQELLMAEQPECMPQCKELVAHIEHIPSKAHKEVVEIFLRNLHDKFFKYTIAELDMMYDGKGVRFCFPVNGRLIHWDMQYFMDVLNFFLSRGKKCGRY